MDRTNEANKMKYYMALLIIWGKECFDKCPRELEVYTATYGPGIDQSQHTK